MQIFLFFGMFFFPFMWGKIDFVDVKVSNGAECCPFPLTLDEFCMFLKGFHSSLLVLQELREIHQLLILLATLRKKPSVSRGLNTLFSKRHRVSLIIYHARQRLPHWRPERKIKSENGENLGFLNWVQTASEYNKRRRKTGRKRVGRKQRSGSTCP